VRTPRISASWLPSICLAAVIVAVGVSVSIAQAHSDDTEDPETSLDDILENFATPELDVVLTSPDGLEYRYVEGPAWTDEQVAAQPGRDPEDIQLTIFQGDRYVTSGILRAACNNETFSAIGTGREQADGSYLQVMILASSGTGAQITTANGQVVSVDAIGTGVVPFPVIVATLDEAPASIRGLGVGDETSYWCPPPGATSTDGSAD
jgi:hypothetical protein